MAKQKKRTDAAPAEITGSSNSPEVSSNGNNRDRVAARAYELYLARGGSHGSDWDDWLQAERELMGGPTESPQGSGIGHHE